MNEWLIQRGDGTGRFFRPRSLIFAAVVLALASPSSAQEAASPPKATAEPPRGIETVLPDQAEGILGKQVWSTKGEDMGLIVDVLVDRNGVSVAAVIDFGGFLGVGNRKIAIDWRLIHFDPGDPKKPVVLDLGIDGLRSAPEYVPGKPARVVGAAQASPEDSNAPPPLPKVNGAE